MVQITQMGNGRCIGMTAAEVTAVPYFELLHQDPDRASAINQVLFTQILTGLHRRVQANTVAVEILWQSQPVSNQTYKAQVHQYIILRQMGMDPQSVQDSLTELREGLANDLTGKGYSVVFFNKNEQYAAFLQRLSETDATSVLAVGKKERAVSNMFYAGSVYCTDVIRPSEGLNIADLTNALTQYPNSVVSLQLIPPSTPRRSWQVSSRDGAF